MAHKQSSALVYLNEELGDARLLCEKLKKYVDRAIQLIEKSGKKDHFFEVAGDIIEGLPKTTQDLHKALQAVALATNRLDYEEVKQTLPAEKVDELEEVLEEIRINPVRRQNMKPEDAVKQLHALAAQTKQAGEVPVDATLDFIAALENGTKTASAEATAETFTKLAEALTNPPKGVQGVSRKRLATLTRQALALSIDRPSLTASRVASRLTAKSVGIQDLKSLQKSLEDILVEAKKSKAKDIEALAAKALKNIKVAGDGMATPKKASSYSEQLDQMKANPPKVRSGKGRWDGTHMVEIYSTTLGKYMPVAEWGSKQEAQSDLKNWEKSHKETLAKLRAAAAKEGKTASDDGEKESRYEEGESVDPTKNMSPEDAEEWRKYNEMYEDKFKEEEDEVIKKVDKAAARVPSPSDVAKEMSEASDMIVKTRGKIRNLTQDLGAVIEDVSGAGIVYSGGSVGKEKNRLKSLKKELYNLDGEMRVYDFIESMIPVFKKHKNDKYAAEDWKESRYEEGESVDPTKNMSPEDAEEWRKYNEMYEDKFKEEEDEVIKKVDKAAAWKVDKAAASLSKDQTYLLRTVSKHPDGLSVPPVYHDTRDALIKKGLLANRPGLTAGAVITRKGLEALKSGKYASDAGEKESRYEEGESVDPTKNMSPEDAEEWRKYNEMYEDKFKEEEDEVIKKVDKAAAWKVEAKYNTADDFQKGDIVRYTAKHRRQIGMQRGGPINGKVTGHSGRFVMVQWNDRDEPVAVSPAAIEPDPRYKNKRAASEKSEMQDILKKHGYDPKDVSKLMKDGIGPEELRSRLKNKPGSMGSLEHSHGLKKKAFDWKAGSSPLAKEARSDYDKIRPGAEVTIADSRGKRQTGKAKSKSPAGWVIDMGGRTSLATPDNVVSVK